MQVDSAIPKIPIRNKDAVTRQGHVDHELSLGAKALGTYRRSGIYEGRRLSASGIRKPRNPKKNLSGNFAVRSQGS
jgi:hypothetical protein